MSGVNEVNMAKWIVALRSGKYQQARGRLHDGASFCCLGVVCEISGLGNWRGGAFATRDEDGAYLPPSEVIEWLIPGGVEANDPPLLQDGTVCSTANDHLKWDFGQIAAALESRYLPGKKAEEILAEVAP